MTQQPRQQLKPHQQQQQRQQQRQPQQVRVLCGVRWSRKRLGAVLLFALNLFYAAQIPDIPRLPVDQLELMNARTLPWALSLAATLCCLLLWVSGAPDSDNPAAHPRTASSLKSANCVVAAGLLVWTAVFGWLLGVIGFSPSVALYLFVGFVLLGERKIWFSLAVASAIAGVSWLLLKFGLGLYLPAGRLWSALGWLNV